MRFEAPCSPRQAPGLGGLGWRWGSCGHHPGRCEVAGPSPGVSAAGRRNFNHRALKAPSLCLLWEAAFKHFIPVFTHGYGRRSKPNLLSPCLRTARAHFPLCQPPSREQNV